MLFAVAVFAGALTLIASERADRTKVALIGASLVLLFGTINEEIALEAIEFEALGLLAGMMIVVRLTESTGVFTYVAIRTGQLSHGHSWRLVLLLTAATGVLSAFLDNLTTVLLVVPVTFKLARQLEIDPIPLVVLEVIASNLGGTATLIGDPPNIMIGAHTGLSFGEFIVNLAPIAVLSQAVVIAVLYVFVRGRLQIPPEARDRLLELHPRDAITDAAELRRVGPIMVAIILVFFLHKPLDLGVATVALGGASVMLAVTRQNLDEALGGIDWPTLFFFLGLFVMVGALEHTGAVQELADGMIDATGGDRGAELMAIAWGSAIVGGIIDNIPLTATMIPVVDEIAAGTGDDSYWWALALGACFGGNLTIVSAAANVAVAGIAVREGSPIGFLQFLKYGVPAVLMSMLLATGYIALRYL